MKKLMLYWVQPNHSQNDHSQNDRHNRIYVVVVVRQLKSFETLSFFFLGGELLFRTAQALSQGPNVQSRSRPHLSKDSAEGSRNRMLNSSF